jgi:N-methylhydantoinase B/oxoprolinase/acetone carboxylase alpha subunit
MNAIELSLFVSRLEAVCDEMAAVLRNAALSPNIRDRLDFSCAVFDADGALCAQAAHIPVHLGSMAYAMADWWPVRLGGRRHGHRQRPLPRRHPSAGRDGDRAGVRGR